jgi:CBS domain-containing protein
MKAKDVMTHCLVSIAPEASISDAIARMISHQVSGMPVVATDGALVGIVTEGDFLRRAEMHTEAPRRRWLELLLGPGSDAAEYARSHGHTVRDVMSPNVVTVGKETPLIEVVRLMEEHAIRRIPVIEDDRVVGIVSRADLMSALAELLIKPTKASPTSDESIRQMILSEMKRQPWCPVQSLGIRVRKGFVELSGTIFDPGQRQALHVLVENVPGVKGLHDHLAEFMEQSVAAPGEKLGAQRSTRASRSPA